jgi:hypothetical protein
VHIEYLPPYSPNLKPIEEAFSKIKNFIGRHQTYYRGGENGDRFLFGMLELLDIITPEDAEGYYIHSGYFWEIILPLLSCLACHEADSH